MTGMATQFVHNGNRYMINDRGQGYRVEKETKPGPRLGAPVYIEDTDRVQREYAEFLASLQDESDADWDAFMAGLDPELDWDIQLQRVYPGAL